MSLWLVRAGKHGEYEKRFIEDNKIYLTWDGLNNDLSKIDDWDELKSLLAKKYPDASGGAISNYSGQIWAFSKYINSEKLPDWVVLPSKHKPAIHIGIIKSDYQYDGNADDPYYHYRDVDWTGLDIPRSNFNQDLLYSFGAFMTVCQIKRNDAEKRIRLMSNNDWAPESISAVVEQSDEDDLVLNETATDIGQIARDQIAKLIIAKFKGHGLTRLVEGILKAHGYTTFMSPPGPDKGIDILASAGSMGFDHPRICVQVKSGTSPLDRPTLDQLIGTMQNVQADQGLLVSWGGFKSSVEKEKAQQFFRVRLWDQNDLIEKLFDNYDDLDQELQAELPLKKIWTLSALDE